MSITFLQKKTNKIGVSSVGEKYPKKKGRGFYSYGSFTITSIVCVRSNVPIINVFQQKAKKHAAFRRNFFSREAIRPWHRQQLSTMKRVGQVINLPRILDVHNSPGELLKRTR